MSHLFKLQIDVVQVSQESKLTCSNNSTTLVDNVACMIGSVVSLAEYFCTHVFLVTVAEENPAPADGFYIDVDVDE